MRISNLLLLTLVVFSLFVLTRGAEADQTIWLSSLDLTKAVQGWGQPTVDKSVGGNPLTLDGVTYAHGFGTHSQGYLDIALNGAATRFTATVGIDDEVPVGHGSAEFIVMDAAGKILWRSGVLRRGDTPKNVDIDLTGLQQITLRVTDGGDGYENDHSDWADAQFTTTGPIQTAALPPALDPVIWTGTELTRPVIHGGAQIGVYTGTPIIWRISVTGDPPLSYRAKSPPRGIAFDASTGIFTGTLSAAGDYPVQINVSNRFGSAQRTIHFVSGSQVALTPPMGWNSYDCFGDDVTEPEIMANADYVAQHLQPYGWDTVVVDYRWYDPRASDQPNNSNIGHQAILAMDQYGRLLPAPNRFPSASDGHGFQALATKMHDMGLKFGIHIMRGIPREAVVQNLPIFGSTFHCSDAANTSDMCGWCDDMYGVRGDTPAGQAYYASLFKLYASWGVDYVKMDDTSAPYHTYEIEAAHSGILASGRSIVYSLSPGETPIEQGSHVESHSNLWRASNDFWDNWGSLDHGFDLASRWQSYVGPGHWPDLDMLPLGRLSVHNRSVGADRMTNFTHAEQMTVVSMRALLPAPLMDGSDLPDNDQWSLALLTNPEVLDLDQDTPCSPATILTDPDTEPDSSIWTRKMSDGTTVVGIFNRSPITQTITVTMTDLGLKGPYQIRDLWLRKDIGTADGQISATVPSHGVVLLRLSKLK